MGIASLVLGIIALIVGFIPCCGMLAFIPAIIGAILGIVDVVKKGKEGKSKGQGIAGLILSVIAIVVIVVWVVIMGAGVASIDSNTISTTTDITNNISATINTTTSKEESKEIKVGETYNDNDVKITFVSANDNFTGYNKYITPANGNKIIRAEIIFENTSNSDYIIRRY